MTSNTNHRRTREDEILHRLDDKEAGSFFADPPVRRMQQLRATVRSAITTEAEKRVNPFLADRVLRAIAKNKSARPDEEFLAGLVRLFRPVAVACTLLIIAFGIHNVMVADQYDAEFSAAEAVVGLPPVTLATAYDIPIWTVQSDQR